MEKIADVDESVEEVTKRIKLERESFVVRENDKLMISCVYEGNDIQVRSIDRLIRRVTLSGLILYVH